MGPTVMVGDWPLPFTIYTKVNGSLRQEGTTTDLIFSIPKLIATLSDGMTLLPGDVIATGTPQRRHGLQPAEIPQKRRCGRDQHRPHRDTEKSGEIIFHQTHKHDNPAKIVALFY